MKMKTRYIDEKKKEEKNRSVISVYLAVTIAFKLYYLFICFDY